MVSKKAVGLRLGIWCKTLEKYETCWKVILANNLIRSKVELTNLPPDVGGTNVQNPLPKHIIKRVTVDSAYIIHVKKQILNYNYRDRY